MTKTRKEVLYLEGDDWRGILLELKNSTDRGAAIVGAAVLDTMLEQLLRLFLVEINGDKEETAMLGPNGPLGSFGTKIRMSYYLGLISADERADLKIIQDIRNDFAHRWRDGLFSDKKTADRCANLRYANKKWATEMATAGWSNTSRDWFIASTVGLIQLLLLRTNTSVLARRCTVPKENKMPPPSSVPPPHTGRSGPPTL
jgi:DNA-binding MltR family transcriptional regulator